MTLGVDIQVSILYTSTIINEKRRYTMSKFNIVTKAIEDALASKNPVETLIKLVSIHTTLTAQIVDKLEKMEIELMTLRLDTDDIKNILQTKLAKEYAAKEMTHD